MALCESSLAYKIQYNLHTLMLSQPVCKNVYNMPHLPPGVFALLVQKSSSVIIHTPSIWNFCIYLKLELFCGLLYDTNSIPGCIVLVTWWLVNGEMDAMWKWPWPNQGTVLEFSMRLLRKTMKTCQTSCCPSWDSNWTPSKYRCRVIVLHKPTWWHSFYF